MSREADLYKRTEEIVGQIRELKEAVSEILKEKRLGRSKINELLGMIQEMYKRNLELHLTNIKLYEELNGKRTTDNRQTESS